jgi:hypothetical protein
MPLGFNAAVQMKAFGCELPTLPGEAQYWTGYFTKDARGGNDGEPGHVSGSNITFVNAGTLTSSDSRFTGNWGHNGCASGSAVNGVGCWYFDAGSGNTDRPTSGSNTQGYHENRGGGMWIYWSCDGSTWSGDRDYQGSGTGYSGLRQTGGQVSSCGSCTQTFSVSNSSTSSAL